MAQRPDDIAAPTNAAGGTGRFIAVEGIDASGKTSIAGELVRSLVAEGICAVLLDRGGAAELAGGYPGEHLRGLATLIWDYPAQARTSTLGIEHWTHLVAAWFFALDQLVVRPAGQAGVCVVADTWHYKFVARFALTVGLPRARSIFTGLSVPDRVLWLDVTPDICLGRRQEFRRTERGEWHGLDGVDDGYLVYQGRVRTVYQTLAAAHGWRVLAGTDPAGLHAAIRSEVEGCRPAGAARRGSAGGRDG